MKWKIQTVGRPALDYARAGVDEYLKRLRRMAEVEWLPKKQIGIERGPGVFVIVLDERGHRWTTEEFRKKVDAWELAAHKQVHVLIGGADGHTDGLRQEADVLLSLSSLTLQHEMALVVFLEQLYRVYTMKRGEPYHR